ncbi:ParB/RepB/Spo0J family partition protein [Nitratifractor sp.]
MALGKGLGAILEEVGLAYESELGGEEPRGQELGEEVVELPVEKVDPNPFQPRRDFDEERLRELGESIRRHGLLQPVVVIPHGDRWLLIAGERRLRAHKMMELPTIRAIVADVDLDELRMRELALVENIQRENLNAVETARAYQELLTVHGITHEELARIVHKSRSQITNTLRLLSLSSYASGKLVEQKITQGHAKVLVGFPEEQQKILVDTIIGRKLSVREAEELAKRARRKLEGDSGKRRRKPEEKGYWRRKDIERLEGLLPFNVKVKKRGLEIRFDSEEELSAFLDFLGERKK